MPQSKNGLKQIIQTILGLSALFTEKGLLELNPHFAIPGHIILKDIVYRIETFAKKEKKEVGLPTDC